MFRLSVAFISLVLLQSAFAAPVLLTTSTSNAAAAALSNRRGDIPPGRINGHSAREDLEDVPDLNIFDDRALLGDILGSSGSVLGPDGGADERKRREETPADLGSTVGELLSGNPAQGLGGSPQDARSTLAARQAGFWDNILNLVVDAPKDVEGPTSENPKKRQAVPPFTGTGVPQLGQPGGADEDAAPQEQPDGERRRQLDLADGEALPADADLLRRQSGVLDSTNLADANSESDLGHVTDEGGILDPVESLTTPGLGDDDDQDGDDDDDQDGGDDDDQDGGDDDDQDGGDDDEDSDDVARQDDDGDNDQDDDQDGDADTEARQDDDGRVEDPNSLADSADDLVSRSEGLRPPRPPVFAPASVPTPPSDSSV